MKQQFAHLSFLLVEEDPQLRQLLLDNGASSVVTEDAVDADKHLPQLTHIIANHEDFKHFKFASEHMLPIVQPQWVYESVKSQRLKPLKPFSPCSQMFLKKVFAAAEDLNETLTTAIEEFGGQWQKNITKFSTHVISESLNTDACVIANSIPEQHIVCVLPQWIRDCILSGKHLREKPYLIGYTPVQESQVLKRDLFAEKKVYFTPDIPEIEFLTQLVTNCGAEVVSDISALDRHNEEDSWFITNKDLESGEIEVARSQGLTIGNVAWLMNMIAHETIVDPESNFLHCPVKSRKVPEFTDLTFSATNYTGDCRLYLQRLIENLGGTFSRSLTPNVDYLICANCVGAKYEATKSWKNVKVLNHRWIEQCYKEWRMVSDTDYKKCEITSISEMLGKVNGKTDRQKKQHLEQSGSVGDAVESINANASETTAISSLSNTDTFETDERHETVDIHEKSASHELQSDTQKEHVIDVDDKSQQTAQDSVSVGVSTTPYKSRKAAMAAAEKLHTAMEDLNEFQKRRKSKKLPELPEERKHKLESVHSVSKKQKTQSPQLSQSPPASDIVSKPKSLSLITTGCDELTRHEVQLLGSIGVTFAKDPLDCNVLVAPRIMRTEKFLVALSVGPDYVLHPEFFKEAIKRQSLDFNIKQFSLDNYCDTSELGDSLQNVLKNARDRKQSGNLIFSKMAFNVSSYVPGGQAVLNHILGAHGMPGKLKLVKNSQSALLRNIKSLQICKDDKTCWLITRRPEGEEDDNSKLIQKFRAVCNKSGVTAKVAEWNWVVACIFSQSTDGHENCLIN